MGKTPQVLPGWVSVEGMDFVRPDRETGLYRVGPGVRTVRTFEHKPIVAERAVVAETEVFSNITGDLWLTWECTDGTRGGPLSVPIEPNRLMVARFPVYADPKWSGTIRAIRITFPEGLSEGKLGPLRLFDFSHLEPKDLQRFAQASATIERTASHDLKVSLQYNGLYLAPMETDKWIQVSLQDRLGQEILSVARPARGNYDARWIDVNFIFPDVPRVCAAEMLLLDNKTGYSIACRAEMKEP